MSEVFKRPSYRLWVLLVAVVLLLTGCYGVRMGVTWPALATVQQHDEVRIAVMHNNLVTLIQPSNGALARLMNADGEVRFTDTGEPRTWRLDGNEYDQAQFFAPPVVLNEDESNIWLMPAYNERMLRVDPLTALAEGTIGVPVAGPVMASPVVTDDYFYVPIKTGSLQAVDRESYDTVWTLHAEEGIWSAPLLHDDVVYITSLDHNIYAVDRDSGESVWDEPVDLQGGIAATPLLYDDHLYAGSFSHHLYKITLDGEIVGTYEGNNWIWSTPVAYDDMIYYTDLSGYVYAIDPSDMSAAWATKAATRGIRPAPVVTEEYVIAASRDGRIYWLDRESGVVVHDREIEGGAEILSDMLLLNPDDGIDIPEPLIVVGTANPAQTAVAVPLDFASGYQGWVYSR